MKKILKQKIEQLIKLLEPKLKLAKERWAQLMPRERLFLVGLGIFIVFSLLFITISGIVKYKESIQRDVNNLEQLTLYSVQVSQTFKQLSKTDVNQVSTPTVEQMKSDIKQVLQIEDPNVISQDGQITVNIPNVQFNLVMNLLDQFRRSYGLFPAQLNIIRQTQGGYVSFNATFWVNQ